MCNYIIIKVSDINFDMIIFFILQYDKFFKNLN